MMKDSPAGLIIKGLLLWIKHAKEATARRARFLRALLVINRQIPMY
ncbi:hypothetical protein HPL003_04760 [Paenibacillus terrae HPL-003]|uniref:Uncharacterized protein n=1 Tax=Paenibacillus terrae (strain HPL-003) TaxID=985665 RepID=G7VVT0_PAETH|nr:hypothetical protein HPL003_04760 [Paenibacillus terrae HPL-003]